MAPFVDLLSLRSVLCAGLTQGQARLGFWTACALQAWGPGMSPARGLWNPEVGAAHRQEGCSESSSSRTGLTVPNVGHVGEGRPGRWPGPQGPRDEPIARISRYLWQWSRGGPLSGLGRLIWGELGSCLWQSGLWDTDQTCSPKMGFPCVYSPQEAAGASPKAGRRRFSGPVW